MLSAQGSTLNIRLADPDPWFIERKIFDYFSSYLQPNSSSSSADAAKFFDGLLPSHRDDNPDGGEKETTGTFLWNAWEAIHKIAEQIPHKNHPAHERLAGFLIELKQFQSAPPTTELKFWGDETFNLWGDLPFFGPTLRESIDRLSPWGPEYKNLNAYIARVFRDGVFDMSFYATRAIVGAVHKSDEVNGDLLAVAQIWFEVAGEKIWRTAQSNVEKGGNPASWSNDDGLFEKRWQFWLERYGELEKSGSDMDERTKEIVKKTKTLMQEIQKR